MKARKQKICKTLQEIEVNVKRLTHIAYPSAPAGVLEQRAIQSFVSGVRYGRCVAAEKAL